MPPVDMNIILYQTPTVEKVQAGEQQNPDQVQRHAAVQEQVELRQKTETVQTPVEPEQARQPENEEKEREKRRLKRERREAEAEEEEAPEAAEAPPAPGRIVDVVI